jgi:hypothetical protein
LFLLLTTASHSPYLLIFQRVSATAVNLSIEAISIEIKKNEQKYFMGFQLDSQQVTQSTYSIDQKYTIQLNYLSFFLPQEATHSSDP